MKLLLLITVLAMGMQKLQAQHIDSLVTAERNYAQEDTLKLDMQVSLAIKFASGDADKSSGYADKAIQLATKLKDTERLGDAYRSSAFSLFHESNYLEAIQNLEKSVACYTRVKVYWKAAYVYITLSDNYRLLSLFPQAIDNILKSIRYFEQIKFPYGICNAVQNLGLVYMSSGEYRKALIKFKRANQIARDATDQKTKEILAVTYLNIGDAYMHLQITDSAMMYNKMALPLFEAQKSLRDINNTLFNLAVINQDKGNNLQALSYFEEALTVSKDAGNLRGQGAALSNIADLYTIMTDADRKSMGITRAQQMLKTIDYYLQSISFNQQAASFYNFISTNFSLSEFYSGIPDSMLAQMHLTTQSKSEKEQYYLNAGMKMAKDLKLLDLQRDGYKMLSRFYVKDGNFAKGLQNYKDYILIRDSISSIEIRKRITRKEMQYEFDKKESQFLLQQQLANSKLDAQQLLNLQQQQELQLINQQKDIQQLAYKNTQAELNNAQLQGRENERLLTISKQKQQLQQSRLSLQQSKIEEGTLQRNFFIAGCIALLIITFFIFRNYYNQKRANNKLIVLNNQVTKEKQKSDELLLNILPEETAAELKLNGYSEARRFEQVTVLFTDIVNFTGISEHLSPQELVNELNYCFKEFDEIITRNNMEKIKTIGDAYLAVCGLPIADKEHAIKTVRAAIGIRDFMAAYKIQRQQEGKMFFELRIGINSGVVVAGIVGIKKYAYDIWGDTVNMAARMEEHSEPGKINISQKTYELVKNDFQCTYRGKIDAKHKLQTDMYFIRS